MFAPIYIRVTTAFMFVAASTMWAHASEPGFGPNTYDRTLQAQASYEALVRSGGWPGTPPSVTSLMPGSQGPDVVVLKQRLIAGGDLPAGSLPGDVYDAAVIDAVKHFQRRHGLSELGTVGRLTLKALNTPVEVRLSQLAATLQRLKGNGFDFAKRYVVVNIPGASVEAVEDGQVRRRHLASVGRRDRPSPVIQSNITSVNLNPYWNAPMSIVRADIIPRMRQDPGFLAKSNMKLLGAGNREIDPASVNWATLTNPYFYVRQEPGPGNALGQLKIDMPNSDSVYMHDTPGKSRFRSDVRISSSGCVRVESVRDLAAWLLEGSDWTRQSIETAIASGERKNIPLKKPVPVAWVYMTGWQDAGGRVQFRDDIYGLDTPSGIIASTIQPRKPKPLVTPAPAPVMPAKPMTAAGKPPNLAKTASN